MDINCTISIWSGYIPVKVALLRLLNRHNLRKLQIKQYMLHLHFGNCFFTRTKSFKRCHQTEAEQLIFII